MGLRGRNMEDGKRYLLLQLNDALFPIGGYSHSYGLETYIQKEIVCDEQTAAVYIRNTLLYNFCQNELLSVKLAYENASDLNIKGLLRLDQIVTASRTPKEVRGAGEKMGSRFVKTVNTLSINFQSTAYSDYIKAPGAKNHAVAYGVFCASAEIEMAMVLEGYLYAQTSAMVTNCVKTIPLSQTSGQKLLYDCHELFHMVMDKLRYLTERDFAASAPGFEIRCMQHEGLYSRLFMS